MPLISLLVYLVVFCVIGYGLWWVCVKFAMPQPVMWICGAILLIVLLLFVANLTGVGSLGSLTLPPPRGR